MRANRQAVLLGVLVLVCVCAIQQGVSCADYYLYDFPFTSTAEGWAGAKAAESAVWYNDAGEDGINGVLKVPSNYFDNERNATFYYTLPDPIAYLCSNYTYIRVWCYEKVKSYISSTSITAKLYYGSTVVDTDTKSWSGTGEYSFVLDGWVDLTFLAAGENLKVEFYASGTGIIWACAIDNFRIGWSEEPYSWDTQLQLIDESSGEHLETFTGVDLTPIELNSGDSMDHDAITDLYTILTFGNPCYRVKIGLTPGTTEYYRYVYITEHETNYAVCSIDGDMTSFLISVIDSSDTFGAGTHFKAIKELGGVNYTVDDEILSWAKICYTSLIAGDYYVLMIEHASDVFIHGNVSVWDNPTYITYSGGAGQAVYNSTAITPQVWNTTVTGAYAEPSVAADVWVMIAADDDWGSWILLGLPILFMIVAGAHYAFASGMIAAAICAALNAAIGYAWYNTAVLGWIAAICLLMLVRDAMKQDHSIGGG